MDCGELALKIWRTMRLPCKRWSTELDRATKGQVAPQVVSSSRRLQRQHRLHVLHVWYVLAVSAPVVDSLGSS